MMLYQQRSTSLNNLAYSSVSNLREVKNMRRTHCSINKLKMFRTSYENPYQSVKLKP
jgi:hypothetical protein